MAKKPQKQLTKVIGICQPPDWWDAWKEAARLSGMTLAAWIGLRCNERLPLSVQRVLSKRGKPGGHENRKGENAAVVSRVKRKKDVH